MTFFNILGTIIFGAVIGYLARLFLPGRQHIGMIMTIVIGIIGALVGYWLAGLFGVASTAGIDWIRWFFSIVVAAIGVVGYERIMARRAA
ncbi:GlsB/YeaQ/YmgE family stress response membrane protein [Oryzihumus leptocrescens]|uniref:Putative membrane protein YeaQ/YmgE (Transglycosylase-associated protein family) n=1 Tax=Oryzihumus leptocrescens TaxID=297536 RepID=A0A542ZM91_9MICO|nr:GlsB/YeaQ/YmgE family stress response membrane protein [Oryzihumus leptocrescens]TQL61458.1 putative membrane protein YeaQ/YmgE (transglycosylase-associated protein family) [Oryzihumus leptocrescens]